MLMMMTVSSEAAAGQVLSPTCGKVLLVDDNEDLRTTVRFVLEDHGYRVREAQNGSEALDALDGFDADVVVLDLHMPVMDGSTFMRALRASGDERTARTPVVLLTAYPESWTEGRVPTVLKPFDMHDLLAAIGQARRRRGF
jgi:two-component system response regulator AtoC